MAVLVFDRKRKPEGDWDRNYRFLGVLSLVLLLHGGPVIAETLEGRVVGVHDGDTITVLDVSKKQHKIRFAQIDAPESRQDFGQASKQSLSDLVFGKQVTVEVETTDKYGRTVGKVLVGGTDANLEQVRRGMAWVYRQYAHDPDYFAAEESARNAKTGLWSRPDAVPPWEFRHGAKGSAGRPGGAARASISPDPRSVAASSAVSCVGKRTCGQMASCDEARHYLRDCGLSRLDRDGDGIPCESLCK
ncbi:thermonuclease family protein [Methylococcus capsulatus]|nr:thermonuclease family protein [Methylococcus capsulatus]